MSRWMCIRLLVLVGICLISIKIVAQLDAPSSRYMQTQYFINPAFSAKANTMTANLMARKQWFGLEGAPQNYQFALYSPINKTMMSVGGGLIYEQYGINKFYGLNTNYSYLVRISPVTFLSMGVSPGFSISQVGYNSLDLSHQNDPYFIVPNQTVSNLNVSTGVYLYTPSFYLGISIVNLVSIGDYANNNELETVLDSKKYYFSAGYYFKLNKYFGIKPSALMHYQKDLNNLSTGVQLIYNTTLGIGVVYNNQGWMSNMLKFQISENFGVAYSFDYTIGANAINRNNHEISMSFNIDSFAKRNRKRQFGRKKKKEKEGIKSLRNF